MIVKLKRQTIKFSFWEFNLTFNNETWLEFVPFQMQFYVATPVRVEEHELAEN